MVIVLIGVSGSGKTTVGRQLARELNWAFHEGDDFHPAANKAKMSHGIALNDQDRAPWLAALRELIAGCLASGENAVLSCSALKQAYRERLALAGVRFVYLKGEYALMAARLERRKGHFFDPHLLSSQFQTLQEPGPREALIVDADQRVDAIAREIAQRIEIAPPLAAAAPTRPARTGRRQEAHPDGNHDQQ